ncbi:TPA: hypothetical protein I9089_002490 [Clostridium perfringens]|nr:hypothetical protein [Clostridium perfringens]
MLKVGTKVELLSDILNECGVESFPVGTEAIVCKINNEDKDFPYKIKIYQYEFWVTKRDIAEVKKNRWKI